MKNYLLLLVIFCTCNPDLHSQAFDKAKMDSLFSRIEEKEKGMGSISLFKEGVEIYQRSFGYADINGRSATTKTKYRIGSVSKTFTASVIMQLIDEAKLALDTKLSRFFPEIPNAENITVEHLLRYRSGLYNFTNAPDYPQWMESPKTRSALKEKFIKNGVVFSPDEKAEYSNTNYVLLSWIAEEIDNKKFDAILQDRILSPLSLENTYYGNGIDPSRDEARSFTFSEGWVPATETDMSIPAGAGAIVSTPIDLNVFFTTLFSAEIVSEASLNEMKKTVDNFGMGLFPIPFYDKKAYGHNGGIDGFQANAAFFPQEQVAIAYTSNGVVMPINDILIGVLSIYFNKPYTLPEFTPALAINSKELDQYLGIYSSPTFPLKLNITKVGDQLLGQARPACFPTGSLRTA